MFTMIFHVFLQVFPKHVSSVSFVFRRMLQVLYLDVSKVDRVLHMLQCACEAEGTQAVPARSRVARMAFRGAGHLGAGGGVLDFFLGEHGRGLLV